MPAANYSNKSMHFYNSCCSNPNKWIALTEFVKVNFISRKQIKSLARKRMVEIILYKGRYHARWSEGINSSDINFSC